MTFGRPLDHREGLVRIISSLNIFCKARLELSKSTEKSRIGLLVMEISIVKVLTVNFYKMQEFTV